MDDEDVVDQLGGFALDSFLSDFTGDKTIKASGLSALGLSGAKQSKSLDASQIYSERFEDEDEGEPANLPPARRRAGVEELGDDWEDEIDKELDEEDKMIGGSNLNGSMHFTKTKMRGEDDDFDEDDDDDDGPRNRDGYDFALPADSELLRVKQEEREENEEQDDDDPDYAMQQQLFQQSIARMQQQQQYQAEGRSPSPPVMDIRTLYPSFAPNKILNFTELFTTRPKKKRRIDSNVEPCTF